MSAKKRQRITHEVIQAAMRGFSLKRIQRLPAEVVLTGCTAQPWWSEEVYCENRAPSVYTEKPLFVG